MRPSLPRLGALALAALVAACGGSSKSSQSVPLLTWTWVPIAGAVCNDNSPTGIGMEVGPGASPNVLVFLDGGGACWDYYTCWLLRTATSGPFGQAQFEARIRSARPGSIFDREAPGNPFKDFTFVFIPYCTGDVHSGDTSQTYAQDKPPWYHHGRVNVSKAFQFLVADLAAPSKVVVSGASAGGFGSLLAFTKAKAAWPAAKAYLVDDSGPPLANIPAGTVAAWVAMWDLGTAVADVCGVACAGDPPTLAPIIPALAKAYPNDRFALLSSTQDATIRAFFGDVTTFTAMDPVVFENSLRALATAIKDDAPPGETYAFVVTGTSHTMLGSPAAFRAPDGRSLFDWLGQQVNDLPSWSEAIPPAP
jgi:hypothetical protein